MVNNKSFTLEKPKKSEGWAKIQEWNKKWNRILAGVFCILAFLVSFAVVLLNIMNSVYDDPEYITTEFSSKTETFASTQIEQRLPTVDCAFYEFHNITCSGGSGDSYKEELKRIIQENHITETNFTIMNWNFENGLLTENWLDLEEITILSLSFVKVNIKDIEDGAFDFEIFQKTKIVTFMDFEISYFKAGMFVGLNSVTEFSLRNFPFKNSDENLLEPMRRTLSTLQIQNVNGKLDLVNITGDGSKIFPYLEIVDLSNNIIEDMLSLTSFTGLTSVVSLYLISAGLTSLEKYTFLPMGKTLQILDLKSNNLKTLPNGIFDYLTHHALKIFLEGNSWDCNCNLVHINDFEVRIADSPKCFSPSEFVYESIFTNTEECITTTTLNPITTKSSEEDSSQSTDSETSIKPETPTTTTISPEVPTNLVGINCNSTPPPEVFRLSTEIFYMTEHDQLFQIAHISEGKVSIDVDPNCLDMVLLWFTFTPVANNGYIQASENFDCLSSLKQSFSISNLLKETSYTFCLVRNNESRISPFNCIGFFTPIEYIENVWLTKDHKTLTLCIIFCVSFFCLMLGAFCAYLLLRRKLSAELLKDPPIAPVEYGLSPSYFSPTNYQTSSNTTRPSFNRSISDSSIESHRSYISAVTPSPFQIISWRMDKNKNKNLDNIYMEKLPDIPPPLPPHPKRKSDTSENLTKKFYPSGISYA